MRPLKNFQDGAKFGAKFSTVTDEEIADVTYYREAKRRTYDVWRSCARYDSDKSQTWMAKFVTSAEIVSPGEDAFGNAS